MRRSARRSANLNVPCAGEVKCKSLGTPLPADPEYFPSGKAYVGSTVKDQIPEMPKYHSYAVEDAVQVPTDIAAGDYVLGWRWDCEQTSQIWASCADITIE
jgi:hypothetical protein